MSGEHPEIDSHLLPEGGAETDSDHEERHQPVDTRYKVYWFYGVVICILNVLWLLFLCGILIHQILLHRERGFNVLPIVFTATGLCFLANGLFGRKNRGRTLFVFLWIYQIVPGVVLFLFLLYCIFGYKFAKEEMKRAYDYVTESSDVEGSTIMLCVLLLTTMLICYHMTAGFVIDRYRQLRRQRNRHF